VNRVAQSIIMAFPVFCLLACGEGPAVSFRLDPSSDTSLRTRAEESIPRLVQACPGLSRYASDLSPATVANAMMVEYPDGFELRFGVAEHPKSLPESIKLRSAGHVCSVTVSGDGTRAYIAKRACHSLCTGVWEDNDANSMGRVLVLK
jgi:hypothetical protein